MSFKLNQLKFTYAIQAWLFVLLGWVFSQQPAAAQTVEFIEPEAAAATASEITFEEVFGDTEAEAAESENAIAQAIDDTLDAMVENAIDEITALLPDSIEDFFGGLSQTIDSFLQVKIPALDEIIDIVFDTKLEAGEADLPSRQQSQALEGEPDGSYAIDDEEATAIVREVIVDTVEATTLSQEAQTRLKQTAAETKKSVGSSINLGRESQTLDVTQQILQNISQQEAIAATREGIVIQQNQQAQVDRALNNLLNTQQAEELAGINTAKRRENLGTSNLAVRQWGLVRLPGKP